MRQRALEIRLEKVPHHPRPEPSLEQYRTPPRIAADMLYRALGRGDISGQSVVDLGCGTGIFLVGAALLGARRVAGVDLDPLSVKLARDTLAAFEIEGDVIEGPVESMEGPFDTAIMNPPFGAQFAQRHADTAFLQHALRLAPVCYSLHQVASAAHLERLSLNLEADHERVAEYDFPIPHQFHFHTKEKVLVRVALYRFARMGAP